MKHRLIIGMTGSSAIIYGIRFLNVLSEVKDIEIHLVLSRAAEKTLEYEAPDWTRKKLSTLADYSHEPEDLAAPIASGSFKCCGMVIIPCSMKTLAHLAHGTGGDLIGRAADVTLKERRKLVIVPRETPLHLGHLRNMTACTEMGGIIVPPMPAFYHQPKSIQDLIDHTLGKILDLLEIDHQLFKRWKSSRQTAEE